MERQVFTNVSGVENGHIIKTPKEVFHLSVTKETEEGKKVICEGEIYFECLNGQCKQYVYRINSDFGEVMVPNIFNNIKEILFYVFNHSFMKRGRRYE